MEIEWTGRETFACALAWASFRAPHIRGGSPEQYWLAIHERARERYRGEVDRLHLLPAVRGDAPLVLPPHRWRDSDLDIVAAEAGLTRKARARAIVRAVWYAAAIASGIRDGGLRAAAE